MNGLKSSERTSKMTVSVRILAGRTINVEVCPADTVHTLKFISQTIGRIRADQQLLTFAGKAMLDDCKTRSDYNVTNGSTVYLSLRLLGGHIMTSTPRVAWPSCQPPSLCAGIERVQGERGVVCSGKRTNQKFVPYNEPFVPREEILFERFTLELRRKPRYSFSP